MRNFFLFAALIAAMSVNANSVFTMPDIIRVSPADRGNVIEIEVMAYIEESVDSWEVEIEYTPGLVGKLAYQLDGTYLQYYDACGNLQSYIVPIHVNYDCSSIICDSRETAYWMVNGRWVPCGLVSWAPGEYRMFALQVEVGPDFNGGQITLSATMRRHDGLNTVYSTSCRTNTQFIFDKVGDVNGDGDVTISDVTALIDMLLTR